jgi:hypothetical protein
MTLLVVKNKNIKDDAYSSLVLYALLRCDAFTFSVPDLYTKITSDTRSDEFLKYKKEIAWRMERFEPYLLNKSIDSEYVGSIRGYYSENYVMSLNIDVIGNIRATEGLYSWMYPEMPEDLSFFSKGKCWMKSIAHEKSCWIYTTNDIEKDILKKVIKLKFFENDDNDAPTLEY